MSLSLILRHFVDILQHFAVNLGLAVFFFDYLWSFLSPYSCFAFPCSLSALLCSCLIDFQERNVNSHFKLCPRDPMTTLVPGLGLGRLVQSSIHVFSHVHVKKINCLLDQNNKTNMSEVISHRIHELQQFN